MFHLWQTPKLLSALHYYNRLRVAIRHRGSNSAEARKIRSGFYESVWRQAANRFGAQMELLDADILQISREEFCTRVLQNDTPLDDYVTLRVAANKPLTYRLLEDRHIRTPKCVVFQLNGIHKAVDFLRRTKKDCVVKPACGWGGVGVTTGVRTTSRLARAAAAASVFGPDIIVQEQIMGDNYRLVYLDGELLDAVVRGAPTLIADGQRTVASLVEQLNATRLRQGSELCQALLPVDLDMKSTLAQQGLSLASRPPVGTVVKLKTVINDNCATENTTATDRLCQSIIDDCAAAAQVLRIRLAGVDMITSNPTVPLKESGGAIIEVNTAPGQYWHYHQRDGAFPLADHILARLLAEHPECGLTREEIMARLEPSRGTSQTEMTEPIRATA